ncbi:uncharacterized protein N7459_003161 [Penicillium hispanicum]|uniref:uncharacterized protein n=1 Tax=Penicillium hispanicum TaxID=1080232 RepID=UPI00253FC885|nr:uncharacterized protein N7459_003161 [Penicillium hispanicum]KAJ5587396.1 hypothetical protein N7459_003161 [Penicillium hispanicum]
MSNEDLKAHAASNQDFYGLLGLSPAANETEIRRAYRRTALKYHPDKIANPTAADIDKFHLLQIAYDVLSDPSVRQLYDNAREARLRKQRERDMMDAAKRKMREDLEARERAGAATMGGAVKQGVKRSWMAADEDAEEKLQREIDRIAEDGRRRRREAEDKLKQEMDEEQKIMQAEEEEARKAADRSSQRVDRSQEGGGTSVSELDRTVKVRWAREGRGLELNADWLATLFTPFGKVENAFMLKDKRARVEGKRGKVTFATGVVVFASIVSAHSAVLDSEKRIRQADGDWALVDSVAWASGVQPNLGPATDNQAPAASSGTHKTSPAPPPNAGTSSATPSFNFPGLNSAPNTHKAPSFGSFASAATASNAPKASSFNPSAKAPGTPSLEELTLMRLKNAQREKERKALEEQLAREDEAADAAEVAAAKAKVDES